MENLPAFPPATSRWHVGWWMLLGYVAVAAPFVLGGLLVGAAFVGMVLTSGGLAWGAMALVAMVGLWLIYRTARCLWDPFPAPSGLVLDEPSHPELFESLRELCEKAGNPRIHEVLLGAELNAAVVQRPRFGVFGGSRNYLVLGLPLMEAMPMDEFHAVLAHEIGHLRESGRRTEMRLLRTHESWHRLAKRVAADGWYPWLNFFLRRHLPRLDAGVGLLSRQAEVDADRFAAEASSPGALARGLRRLALAEYRVETRLRRPLESEIDGTAPLPDDLMARVVALLAEPVPPEEAAACWHEEAVAPTGRPAVHLRLSERLATLGEPKGWDDAVLKAPMKSAAEILLAPQLRRESGETLSREWLKRAEMQRVRRTLRREIERNQGTRKAWDRIASLVRLDGLNKVQPEVEALLARHPAHSGALFLRGSHLAETGDPGAREYLERATGDPAIAGRAFEALIKVHEQDGRGEEARQTAERGRQHEADLRLALVERSCVMASDQFLPFDLTEGEAEAIRGILAQEPSVKRAWVAAKVVRIFPRWANFVIVIDFRLPPTPATLRRLDSRLAEIWGAEAFITVVSKETLPAPLRLAIRRDLPDALIFSRK